MKFTQEAFPVRLKQIHLINVSPVLNKILLILKPFMKTSVSELLNFHLPSSSSFYEHVPIELLPDEYGGKAGRMQDIKENFIMRLESKRLETKTTVWSQSQNNFLILFILQRLLFERCALETT